MAAKQIDIRAQIDADPAEAWGLLDESSTWPSWTPIDSCEIKHPSNADGLGEVRVFTNGRVVVTEETVEREPEWRLTDRLLDGLAVRDYEATIRLEPTAGGAAIHWHTTFEAKTPGTGWVFKRALTRATTELAEGLAAAVANPRD